MGFVVGYIIGFAIWVTVAAFGRALNSDSGYWVEREWRKKWSQMLILSPVWPLASIWYIWKSVKKAYEESGFDENVRKWKK